MHVRPLPLARDLERGSVRLVVALTGEHSLGAGALDRGELRERNTDREYDAGRNPKELRRECDALSVIAGRRGDHAVRALALVLVHERVQRAADLERAGLLQVLELEVDLAAGESRQRVGLLGRRAADVRADRGSRVGDGGRVELAELHGRHVARFAPATSVSPRAFVCRCGRLIPDSRCYMAIDASESTILL